MAEPKFEDIESWLIENADKKGTPDYVHMASAYKALDPQRAAPTTPAAPAKSFGEDMWGRAKLAFGMPAEAPAAGTPEPESIDINDILAAKRLTSDPYSVENTGSRVLAGAIGGIPDLGIGIYNAGARAIGSPDSQAAYLTPKMLANAGTAALPADAPWYRTLGEAAGSGFLGGGAGAAGSVLQGARTAATTAGTALPVVSTDVRAPAPVAPTRPRSPQQHDGKTLPRPRACSAMIRFYDASRRCLARAAVPTSSRTRATPRVPGSAKPTTGRRRRAAPSTPSQPPARSAPRLTSRRARVPKPCAMPATRGRRHYRIGSARPRRWR